MEGLSADQVARDEDFWFDVSQAFTVDRNIINLNNGTLQPSLDPAESCAIATFAIDGADHATFAQMLLDDHAIVVSHMKHAKFEGLRVVPNVAMTVREIDYFADMVEREIARA